MKKHYQSKTVEEINEIIDYEANKSEFQSQNDFIAYVFYTINYTEELCENCDKMLLGKVVIPWKQQEDEKLDLSARAYAQELYAQLDDILDDEDILPSDYNFRQDFPQILSKPLRRIVRFLGHIITQHGDQYQSIGEVVDEVKLIYYFMKKYNICDSKEIQWMTALF